MEQALTALTSRQVVEVFHLVFVRALFSDVTDRGFWRSRAGSTSLFFQSVRYSEDLDLDVIAMSKATLEKRIDRLLVSPAVVTPLRARGLTIQDISKPKQTETVQRWKCSVATRDGAIAVAKSVEPGWNISRSSERLRPLSGTA